LGRLLDYPWVFLTVQHLGRLWDDSWVSHLGRLLDYPWVFLTVPHLVQRLDALWVVLTVPHLARLLDYPWVFLTVPHLVQRLDDLWVFLTVPHLGWLLDDSWVSPLVSCSVELLMVNLDSRLVGSLVFLMVSRLDEPSVYCSDDMKIVARKVDWVLRLEELSVCDEVHSEAIVFSNLPVTVNG
jgi:hypothetical protein